MSQWAWLICDKVQWDSGFDSLTSQQRLASQANTSLTTGTSFSKARSIRGHPFSTPLMSLQPACHKTPHQAT